MQLLLNQQLNRLAGIIQINDETIESLENIIAEKIDEISGLELRIEELEGINPDTILIIQNETGIEEYNESIRNVVGIDYNGGLIYITNPVRGTYFLYNISGQLIATDEYKEGLINIMELRLGNSVYILTTHSQEGTLIVYKFIK